MCTASWLLNENGYQLFFNRDEQKGRAKAKPPERFVSPNGIGFIMPVDPVGQGSWIATNELGVTLCLLNYYQGQTPKGELISRGQLVRNLAGCTSSDEIVLGLSELPLRSHAPFTLVVFDAQLSATQSHVKALQWDGSCLVDSLPVPPLISSAVHVEQVAAYRRELFARCNTRHDLPLSRLDFHHSHEPEKGFLSPCMHRADAHTVSFCHITVSTERILFDYQDGAPCEQGERYCHTLARKKYCQTEKSA